MVKFVSRSAAQTRRIAGEVLRECGKGRPLILALVGELGSGKTTFIQGLAGALGIREKVQSPTFVLMKRYRLGGRVRSFRHLVHIDAYRLRRPAEAERLGFKQLLRDREAVVVIEWADRIRELVPRGALWIQFKHGRHLGERVIGCRIQKSKIKMQEAPGRSSNRSFAF